MLLHLALGDAYGCGFEFVKPEIVAARNNLKYRDRRHKDWVSKGMYTDDTQMSLALAEAIIENDPWTPESLAQRFVDVFKRDKRRGYSLNFYKLLDHVKDGKEFLKKIKPVKDSSGAAMRSCPIGVLDGSSNDILRHCEIQARITHDTEMGVASSQAVAIMIWYMYHQMGKPSDIMDILSEIVPNIEWSPWEGRVGNLGVDVVRAAATVISRTSSLSIALKQSIAFTGDVDTVAAIVMAACAHHPSFKQDLPAHLYTGLEHGKYGYQYLYRTGRDLLLSQR